MSKLEATWVNDSAKMAQFRITTHLAGCVPEHRTTCRADHVQAVTTAVTRVALSVQRAKLFAAKGADRSVSCDIMTGCGQTPTVNVPLLSLNLGL